MPLAIEYRDGGEAAAPVRSEVGYLLAPLGARPVPALAVHVGATGIEVLGRIVVGIESRDGAAHRARVELRAPRGLNVLDPPLEVDVPAGGRTEASFRVARVVVAPGRPIGVLAVAGVVEGPLQRDSVGEGSVRLRSREAWLPRLRRPLAALAVGLLGAAAWVEWSRRRHPNRLDG